MVPATVPGAPTGGTATAGNAEASVAFTAPASDGGSAITSYTVTATDTTTPANGGQTATGAASPLVVTGLTNGDSYTFTVTATNGAGTGLASSPSNAVVPDTVPGPRPSSPPPPATPRPRWPSPPRPRTGVGHHLLHGDRPDSTTPANGGQTVTGAASPLVVTGLTNGDSYTFTVTATNGVGHRPGLVPVQRRGAGHRPGCSDRRHRHRRQRPGCGDLHRTGIRRGVGHHLLHGDGHRLHHPGQRGPDGHRPGPARWS